MHQWNIISILQVKKNFSDNNGVGLTVDITAIIKGTTVILVIRMDIILMVIGVTVFRFTAGHSVLGQVTARGLEIGANGIKPDEEAVFQLTASFFLVEIR